MITAFPDELCKDAGVSAGELPNGRLPGACKEIIIEAEDGPVSEGGQSARYTCVSVNTRVHAFFETNKNSARKSCRKNPFRWETGQTPRSLTQDALHTMLS